MKSESMIPKSVQRLSEKIMLRRLRPLERIEQLLPVALRDRVTADAVAARPLSLRQMMRAEQAVGEREVDREIHVDRFLVDAVVPMMEARPDQHLLEETEIGPDIGVDEGR